MATKLSDFTLIDSADLDVIRRSNDTGSSLELSKSIVDLFHERVDATPRGVACIDRGRATTYATLERRVNQLANDLVARGVGPDVPVGVLFERSTEQLVAILGVLASGGCYVPLDPRYPAEYLRQILADARPHVLVADPQLHERLGAPVPDPIHIHEQEIPANVSRGPVRVISPQQLAYVMYTSGSTGRPKGVMVPHQQILNWLYALWERAPFAQGDVVAQKTSTSFAISVKELFAGLLAGAPQVFIDDDTVADPLAFVGELARAKVSRLYTFPSQLRTTLDAARPNYEQLRSLRHLFVSIEPWSAALVERLLEAMPWVTPWYIYGSTEINDITYCDPGCRPSSTGFVPVGRPIRNTRVHLLDEDLRPIPLGATGEIYVESLSTARGYWGRPDLTVERFIANPHGPAGSRLYKTGDLARYLPDGSLELLGREDGQVKVRGYRVDVRQVEESLVSHPRVLEAAAVGWSPGTGSSHLLAYVVATSPEAVSGDQLRSQLAERLPAYMIPTVIQILPALPRLPNGKVDLLSLPAPALAFAEAGAAYVAPRSATEEALAEIWTEVLRPGTAEPFRVGVKDNFFDLGGHSLLAAQMFSRMRDKLGVELPISLLFELPVLEAFAKSVDTVLAERNSAPSSLVRRTPGHEGVPLSYAQERLWFVHQHMTEQRTSYNVAFASHLRGKLSVGALRAAVAGVVMRHESLRTTFVSDERGGPPVQRIAEALWLEVPVHDVDPGEVPRHIAAHADHVFDLAAGPLLRVTLLRVGPEHHVLMMNIHHIICDGWSIGVLMRDLWEFYAAAQTGAQPRLPTLPIQYPDYAVWQREQDLSRHFAYWKDTLAGYEEGLSLPYDFARPPGRAWQAAVVRRRHPPGLAARLSELSARHQATPFMTLVASVAVLLSRYTERDDLCVGTTVAGRDYLELEELVGFFINIVAIRLDLSGNPSFETILERTRARLLEGMEHRELPFEHVLAALHKRPDSSQIPLVPVMVRHQRFPTDEAGGLGSQLEASEVEFGERTTPNELDLQFIGDGDSLEVVVEYAQSLFSERTVTRLVEHHRRVLEIIVDDPSRRLSDFELEDPAGPDPVARPKVPREDGTGDNVVTLFADRVDRSPDALACVGPGGPLTFRELDRRSAQLAHALLARGVGSEVRVGVWFRRSIDSLVAFLGVLKAGGCYVPLDPAYPQAYVEAILSDARPRLVVASRALGARLEFERDRVIYLDDPAVTTADTSTPNVAIHADQLAYVMYTSGSTGRPKGVMVPHRQIPVWLRPQWARAPFEDDEVVAHKTSTAFAVSVKERLAGLLAGVAQVAIEECSVKDVAALVRELEKWQVSRLYTLPPQLDAILNHVEDSPERLRSLRHVFISLEPCPVELLERLHAMLPASRAWNVYGCTELNDMTYCGPDDSLGSAGFAPAGRPIDGTRALVLDGNMKVVPSGVMGELFVDNPGAARGYWRRPELTADRFVANPYGPPGTRLYRTGDMARLLRDGSLEFLGRRGDETKIRGHRVDIRHVHKAVVAHPDVTEAAVVGWPRGSVAPQLLAYVVPRAGRRPTRSSLRESLANELPTYMVPTLYQFLDELPRLPNGKLDRVALPEPDVFHDDDARVAPRTETEKDLAKMWSELLARGELGTPTVNANDNFFDLGGHSLLAESVLAYVRARFGIEVSFQTLFGAPVLEEFARAVDRAVAGEADDDTSGAAVLVTLAGDSTRPKLFCVHPVGGQGHVYRELARSVQRCAHVLAIQSDRPRPFRTLESLASFYADELCKAQPQGSFRLLGWSSGGLLALAVARELERLGRPVEYLGLIDSSPIPAIAAVGDRTALIAATNILGAVRRRAFSVADIENARSFVGSQGWTADVFTSADRHSALERLASHFDIELSQGSMELLLSRLSTTRYYVSLLAGFEPGPLQAHTHVYRAADLPGKGAGRPAGWRAPQLDVGAARQMRVSGNHFTVIQRENAAQLGAVIAEQLAALQGSPATSTATEGP